MANRLARVYRQIVHRTDNACCSDSLGGYMFFLSKLNRNNTRLLNTAAVAARCLFFPETAYKHGRINSGISATKTSMSTFHFANRYYCSRMGKKEFNLVPH